MRSLVRPLLESMRPHQWVKNLLVLAPLPFAYHAQRVGVVQGASGAGESDALLQVGLAFATFCALSSAIYLLNDLADREADAKHPTKRERPIASGRLPVNLARFACAVLAGLAAAGAVVVSAGLEGPLRGPAFWIWPASYALLNLGYTFKLKHMVIFDVLCIALGFQIRVQAGAAAIDVEASSWIVLCTFFFALFLATCKRRDELARSSADGPARATMRAYTLPFLDQIIAPLAALSILTYALYTLDAETAARHGTRNLMFTVPIVVFGVFRYLFLVHDRGGGEDPAKLLFRDKQILASGVLWVIAVAVILG